MESHITTLTGLFYTINLELFDKKFLNKYHQNDRVLTSIQPYYGNIKLLNTYSMENTKT